MLSKKDTMKIVGRVYRHKIEVWDLKFTVENEVLEEVQVPQKKFTLWADVIPLRGQEYMEAQKVSSQLKYKIITRYRKGIDPSMIIKWDNKELNINGIIDVVGREEHMEIMCTEKVKTNG